jgi:lipopolysaccharide biosynthesis glycosyltransferase
MRSSNDTRNLPALVPSAPVASGPTHSQVVEFSDACIVFAVDETYAMPLATAIRSLVEADEKLAQIDIYVLSNGVSGPTRQRIADSFAGFQIRLHWLPIDLAAFSEFGTLHYATKMTFARLKIPELLPVRFRRALYIDADVLILHEIADLLLTDLQGAALGAVADAMEGDAKSGSKRLHGVPPVKRYFNAGVLLIDLEQWKETCVSERAFRFLEQNPGTPYADQDALNAACDGVWTMLDERWNFQLSQDVLVGSADPSSRPSILHFVTSDKPWHPHTRNRNAALYDQFRSRTRFARSRMRRGRDHLLRAWSLLKRSVKAGAARHTNLVRLAR